MEALAITASVTTPTSWAFKGTVVNFTDTVFFISREDQAKKGVNFYQFFPINLLIFFPWEN